MKISPRCALLAGAMSLLSAAASAATSFTYQKIAVKNSIQTIPVAINDAGTVAGMWEDSQVHGFVYQNGAVTSFDIANATGLAVAGMNNKGNIVGSYLDSAHTQHGFIRSANGTFTTVDVPHSPYAALTAINDKGVAVGNAQDSAGYQAVLTYDNGVLKTVIDTHLNPIATAINNLGSVAGFYSVGGNETAFFYAKGTVTTLPITLYPYSASFAVNNHNEVVGQAAEGLVEHGFVCHGAGKAKYIGPHGSTESYNLGVNDAGVIVGVSYNKSGNSTGFSYVRGVYKTLSVPGYSNTSATAINNAGQILGSYYDPKTGFQTFLATPAK